MVRLALTQTMPCQSEFSEGSGVAGSRGVGFAQISHRLVHRFCTDYLYGFAEVNHCSFARSFAMLKMTNLVPPDTVQGTP